jgi:SAM-dependent methyltransferase
VATRYRFEEMKATADLPEALVGLADTLLALGRADEAAAYYARALRIKETPESITGFVCSLAAAELRVVDRGVREMAIRALATPWSRPADLASACIRIIAGDVEIRACIDRAWHAWPERLAGRDLWHDRARRIVFGVVLLRTLLESTPVCDLNMERLLTMARYALLEDAADEAGVPHVSQLAFACALARQCFINDYVFSYTEHEIEHARAMCDRLVTMVGRGEVPSPMTIPVVAAYFPLIRVPHTDVLLSRAWDEPIAGLLIQQLREPMEERSLRGRIPRLASIDDDVSRKVRHQYEEHPYPRWVKLPRMAAADAGNANPDVHDSLVPGGRLDETEELDILVAGCGTGRESIEVGQIFPRARVLAVDLSLTSLAYAVRKADELRVGNVVHAQADITNVGCLGRRFDIIYTVGVLHHLADPLQGWRNLVSVLKPGGHMLVGVYSERGRRDVVAARAFIAERGYTSAPADIRRCRQELMAVERGARFASLAHRADFYVTGECRDLLFHVQEHRFTLRDLRKHIDALGLRFNGFVLSDPMAIRYGDAGSADCEDWERFEARFPDAFAGMYLFWVQEARTRCLPDPKGRQSLPEFE